MLKGFRNQAFRDGHAADLIIDIKSKGNSSINNTIYKMVEKMGYFEKLEKYEKEREKLLKK